MIQQVGFGTTLYAQTVAFRDEHLRRPLGLRQTPADLEGEDQQIHLAAVADGRVQATLSLRPLSSTRIKLRQMAVVPERRGTGLGSELVRFGEALAWRHGYREAELHARLTARPFYERLGYAAVGDEFQEVGIPHIAMLKQLRD